jgi:hypothetical protein
MTVADDEPQLYSFQVSCVYQVLRRGTEATTNDGSDALPKPCGPVYPYRLQNRGQAQSMRDLPCEEIAIAVRLDSVIKSIIKVRTWESLQLIICSNSGPKPTSLMTASLRYRLSRMSGIIFSNLRWCLHQLLNDADRRFSLQSNMVWCLPIAFWVSRSLGQLQII